MLIYYDHEFHKRDILHYTNNMYFQNRSFISYNVKHIYFKLITMFLLFLPNVSVIAAFNLKIVKGHVLRYCLFVYDTRQVIYKKPCYCKWLACVLTV